MQIPPGAKVSDVCGVCHEHMRTEPCPLAAGPTVYQADEPLSTCCDVTVRVTRVVRDLVNYNPVLFNPNGGVLEVSYYDSDCLDSETGIEVTCDRCGTALDVEVEEQ